jgi:hypothetical protein
MKTWTAGLDVTDEERAFAQRRRGRYGVHFVPLRRCDPHSGVPPINARVEKVDLTQHFKAGMDSPSQVFKLIEKAFTTTTHFVAVYGLTTVRDDLLKWCCEGTAGNPWETIYFIDCDPSFKLIENLDRCTLHAGSISNDAGFMSLKLEPPSIEALHTEDARSIVCRAVPDWKDRVQQHLNSLKRYVPLLIVGGPGIGKTYNAEVGIRKWCHQQTAKGKKTVFKILDGSSPVLINSSLWDVLERDQMDARGASTIVTPIDEWHMMSGENDERKKQAIQWFKQHPNMVPVLLSNRYDSSDEDLLKSFYPDTFCAQSHIVNCMLAIEEYIQIMVDKEWLDASDDMAEKRVVYFLQTIRLLFGHEVIGLSICQELRDMIRQFKDKDIACKLMIGILQRKVPSLDEAWRKELVRKMYNKMVALPEPGQECTTPDASMDLIDLLLHAAHLPRQTPSPIPASYLEYVRDAVKNSFMYSPGHLVYEFILYLHEFAGIELEKAVKERMLQTVCSCNVVGMPMLFPRFLLDPCLSSEETTIVYQDVNPGNLNELIAMLKRGVSPDWTRCKKYWMTEGITDLPAFIRLVSIWPSALHYVDSQNLCNLLKSSRADGPVLARCILREMSAEKHKIDEPMNLYLMAAWWLLRAQPQDAVEELADGNFRFKNTKDQQGVFNVEGIHVDLKNLLRWASANSHHQTTIFEMDTKVFESALKFDLLVLSAGEHGSVLLDLWGDQFAFLLSVGEDGLPWASADKLADKLASEGHSSPSCWPAQARALCELWAGHMKTDMAKVLADDGFFRMLWELDIERRNKYLTHLVASIEASQQPLPALMQIGLLTSGLPMPDDLAHRSLLKTFEDGLRHLQAVKVPVAVRTGAFWDTLQKVAGEALPAIDLVDPKPELATGADGHPNVSNGVAWYFVPSHPGTWVPALQSLIKNVATSA